MEEEKIESEDQEEVNEEYPECHTKNYGQEDGCETCGVAESCLEGTGSDDTSDEPTEEVVAEPDDVFEVVTEDDGEKDPVICAKCESTMMCPTCDIDVNHITLVNFINKISDVQWGLENGFHPGQLNMLREMIAEMQNNKGYKMEGLRSIDGYIMHPCPKHDYAPISICLHQCDFYVGRDDRGVCTCKEPRIDGHTRYDHLGARQEEDHLRKMYWDEAQQKINMEDKIRNEFTEFGLGKKNEEEDEEDKDQKGKKA